MGLTRIKTGQSYVIFAQPAIGSNVTIRVDVQIAWINDGYSVHIPEGGIYEVVSVVAFNLTLKLIKGYVAQGQIVGVDVIYPIVPDILEIDDKADESIEIETTNGIEGGGRLDSLVPIGLTQSVRDDLAKAHTHNNKTVLDGITDILVENWNDAFDKKAVSIAFTGDTNKTLTLTREDGSILTASFLDNNDPQLPDDVINSLEFNLNNDGVLTAITSEGAVINVSLDGRYSLLGHKHVWADITDRPTKLSQFTNDLGNYGNWITKVQGDGWYEPIFSKNSAFNKDFGTGNDDVARGNHNHTFASLTGKPTTIGGYGITDFNSLGDARWALRTRTISGTGSLTGGGNLTANRTIDLTATTKSDIAKGVTAQGWGNHTGRYLELTGGKLEDSSPTLLELNRTGSQNQVSLKFGTSSQDAWFGLGTDGKFKINFDSNNISNGGLNIATETWVNNQGFLKSNALNNYYTITEADGRFALRTRTITGTGGLTGGGNLTANRTIGLSTDTQEDIAKGVTANGWGNHATADYLKSYRSTNNLDLGNLTDYQIRGLGIGATDEFPNSNYGNVLVIRGGNSDTLTQIGIPYNRQEIYFRSNNLSGISGSTWNRVWHDGNFTPSNYYTKNESLNQFVGLAGVQDIADTKTFLASPVVPNPTLDSHAVNKGWVEDEINGIQGQLETFLVGSDGGRLSLGMSIYRILGEKIDVIYYGGVITAQQDLNQIFSGNLSIEMDEIPGLPLLAYTTATVNRFRVGTTYREDVRAYESPNFRFSELRQGAVTSSPLTSSIFTAGVREISIKLHISGIIIT